MERLTPSDADQRRVDLARQIDSDPKPQV